MTLLVPTWLIRLSKMKNLFKFVFVAGMGFTLTGCLTVVEPTPVYVAPRPVYVATRPVYVYPRPVYVAPRPVYVRRCGYRYC